MDAEVIVAGGGPAGSATAALLARAGHDVLLLDRARFPRDKACAEYLSPATSDVLERLGALPAVEALGPARPLGMRLVAGGRARALVRYPDGDTARRALCLPRTLLDATLLDHARACGVRVCEGQLVQRVEVGTGEVSAFVHTEGSRPDELKTRTAQLVIGADGARSAVSRSLGLDLPVRWPRRLGLVAHYADVADGAALDNYGEMHVGSGVYCGLAPLPNRVVNVGLVMRESDARGAGAERAFQAALSHVPGADRRLRGAKRVGRLRGQAPLAHRVRCPSGERYMLVGDAAGFFDPFTGEGVFRALRGAELCAEIAHRSLARGDCSAASLRPYAERRREEFGAKDALCLVIQLFLGFPPLLGYALRRIAAREPTGNLLGGVLGDYRPARLAMRPAFLWGLLRP